MGEVTDINMLDQLPFLFSITHRQDSPVEM